MGNEKRLLWAGFMAILAAGVGFAIRGGIFDNWGAQYGFTATELGAIGGAGFTGFCFGIIIGGVIVDKIGYGKLVIAAFVLHVLSAVVTFAAPETGKEAAYTCLVWGMFIFALANGTLEAVANPLVATLFPKNRTHYLNILHASWPLGMIIGSVAGWILDDMMQVHWKIQLALYLVPTAAYGVMFMGQKFPRSEAAQTGAGIGEMFKDVGILGTLIVCYLLNLFFTTFLGMGDGTAFSLSAAIFVIVQLITHSHGPRGAATIPFGAVMLFVLFITHALVGAVELGTDGWIQNITGNLFTSAQGKLLFFWTSAIMFSLRFCAHWIEKTLKLSPVGILMICAVIACIGLQLSSGVQSLAMAFIALGIYAVGKTFFWPTMLAVVGDRFPNAGAVAMSIMGGIGMLSAGLVGGPGLGYGKDRFAGEALKETSPALYEQYKAGNPSTLLNIKATSAHGLDGKKLGAIQGLLTDARTILADGKVADLDAAKVAKMSEADKKAAEARYQELKGIEARLRKAEILKTGPNPDPLAAYGVLSDGEKKVLEASITGDRKTLKWDSFIPAIMAAIYLLLFIYFKSIGGYKPVSISAEAAPAATGPPK
jgi:MFS family permease